MIRYNTGDKIDFWLKTVNSAGVATAPSATPTVEVVHIDSGVQIDLAATNMVQVDTTTYRYEFTAPSYVGSYSVTFRATIDSVDVVHQETFIVGDPSTLTFYCRFVDREGAEATIKGGTTPQTSAKYYDGSIVQNLFTGEDLSVSGGLYYYESSLPAGIDDLELIECFFTATYDDDTVVTGTDKYQGQNDSVVIATGFDLVIDDEAMLESTDGVDIVIEDNSILETQDNATLTTEDELTINT